MKNNKIYTLGISCLYHDSSSVLLENDEIVSASQEERFTRNKFENSFPINSINNCIENSKIDSFEEIDNIAFYEEPLVKLDRIVSNKIYFSPFNLIRNTIEIANWMENKFFIDKLIKKSLPSFNGNIQYFRHHLSHAASAFYPSPFDESTILTIDGVGEWSCTSFGIGKREHIEIISEQFYPHSVGFLYSTLTQFIGFKVDSGEYKLMGLAPYGTPRFKNRILDNIVNISHSGEVELNLDYFSFMNGTKMYSDKMENLFEISPRKENDNIKTIHMDIASSIQAVIEDIVFKMVKYAIQKTQNRNLCLAGGVALNCVSNGKLINSGLIDGLWIQPASGDAGCALGAAYLMVYHNKLG